MGGFAIPLAISAGATLLDKLTSSGPKTEKLSTMNPGQDKALGGLLELLQSLGGQLQGGQLGEGYEQGLSQLMELLDPSSSAFERFSKPYQEQFEQQTVPQLAERFAGMGGGALSSSGFGQALSSAGSGLQTDLAGLKSQLQQGAIQDLLGQYNSLLGNYQGLASTGLGKEPFAYKQTKATQGLGSSLLSGYNTLRK